MNEFSQDELREERRLEAADIRAEQIRERAEDMLDDEAEIKRLFMDYPDELGAIFYRYDCPQALKNAMRHFLRSALIEEIGRGLHDG